MTNVSMQDIAEKLNISKSLVSLAIGDKYGVNYETRSKIILTAIQMGYDFSKLESIRRKKKRDHHVSVFINQKDLMTDRFWPQILMGVEAKLIDHKYQMKAKVWNDKQDCDKLIMEIIEEGSIGIIVISELPQIALDTLLKIKIPIVMIDGRQMYDAIMDTVRANNYAGSYEATKFILSKGHKKICFIGHKDYSFSFQERYYGFRDYVEKNSNYLRPFYLIGEGDPEGANYTYNRKELETFITNNHDLPTAFICANDPIAFDVFEIIKEKGYRIPDDISIIGFDFIKMCELSSPKLTSVNVPKQEMGEFAVKLLIDRINDVNKPFETINLGTTLIEKDSVKDIN